MEKLLGSVYEAVTEGHVCLTLCLFAWVSLRKFQGHEDMFDDGSQNTGIEMIGRMDGHDCRERDCRWGSDAVH